MNGYDNYKLKYRTWILHAKMLSDMRTVGHSIKTSCKIVNFLKSRAKQGEKMSKKFSVENMVRCEVKKSCLSIS